MNFHGKSVQSFNSLLSPFSYDIHLVAHCLIITNWKCGCMRQQNSIIVVMCLLVVTGCCRLFATSLSLLETMELHSLIANSFVALQCLTRNWTSDFMQPILRWGTVIQRRHLKQIGRRARVSWTRSHYSWRAMRCTSTCCSSTLQRGLATGSKVSMLKHSSS